MNWLAALQEGQELYQIALDARGPIIFKLLPYGTFLGFQRLILNHPRIVPVIEDEIWLSCVLEHPYAEPLDDLLAGTVSTVAELILFLSGLPDIRDKQAVLEASRARAAADFHLQVQVALCRAFPAYTPEQLEKLSLPQLLLRVAQAEQILGQQFTISEPDVKQASSPAPAAVDFEAENRVLREAGIGIDPHDLYGLRQE